MMNKYQTKRVLSNKFQAAVTKSGNSGEKSRSNRFHSLITPDADDYEVCFPSLSSSNPKIQKEIRSPDLFFDVDDVKITLLKMIRDLSLDRRSRSTIFAVVKDLEDEVNIAQGVPNDPARLASLEARINRLKRLTPNQLVKELNLKFCPLTSSGGVFPLNSGKAISAKDTLVDEVTEATVGKTEHFLSSGPQRCEGNKGVGDVEAVVQPGENIPRPPSSDEPPSSEADDDGDTGSGEVGTTSGEEDCDTEGGGDSSTSGVSVPSHSLSQVSPIVSVLDSKSVLVCEMDDPSLEGNKDVNSATILQPLDCAHKVFDNMLQPHLIGVEICRPCLGSEGENDKGLDEFSGREEEPEGMFEEVSSSLGRVLSE
ncbi:hypothetical protein U1Q18_022613, partial [Sarracenia purpurea var. burkii]